MGRAPSSEASHRVAGSAFVTGARAGRSRALAYMASTLAFYDFRIRKVQEVKLEVFVF